MTRYNDMTPQGHQDLFHLCQSLGVSYLPLGEYDDEESGAWEIESVESISSMDDGQIESLLLHLEMRAFHETAGRT